jgi:hypothetical protein
MVWLDAPHKTRATRRITTGPQLHDPARLSLDFVNTKESRPVRQRRLLAIIKRIRKDFNGRLGHGESRAQDRAVNGNSSQLEEAPWCASEVDVSANANISSSTSRKLN